MNFEDQNSVKRGTSRHCERSLAASVAWREAIQNLLYVTRYALLFQHRDTENTEFHRDIPRNDEKWNFCNMLLFVSILLLTLAACTNSSRPGLSDKQLLSLESPERDDTERIVNFSDTIPAGVKYSEERAIDNNTPPVTLDLHSLNIESRNFDPADYYSKVSYIKIKHPFAESGGKFVYTWGISFGSFGRGGMSIVKLSDKYIFVNDFLLGLFCYDAQGNFLDTIAESSFLKNNSNEGLSGDKSGGLRIVTSGGGETVYIYGEDIIGYLGEFSIIGDDCLFLTLENEVPMMNFYNIPTKMRSADIEKDVQKINFQNLSPVTVPPKRPYRGGTPVLLTPSSYVMETLDPTNMRETFLTTFGIQGDTLCRFQDLVPKVKVQTAAAGGADRAFSYLLNNQYTVRQQYNDTVFRLTADNRLTPVYILDFGEKRMDKRSGLIGDKSGKLSLWGWDESNQFICIVFTENYDCPNTRQKDEVKFFYRFYHKRDKKLYQIPAKEAYPEDVIVENSLPNALPFTLNKINVLDDMLYVVYSKTDLQKLMEQQAFSTLPERQKARVKQYYEELNDDEVLIMKME